MRIDGSIILDTQCIFEKDLPKVIVGNTWYITIQNKGDKVGKLWVPDVNGNPVCIGIQDITSLETRIQNAENQINVLSKCEHVDLVGKSLLEYAKSLPFCSHKCIQFQGATDTPTTQWYYADIFVHVYSTDFFHINLYSLQEGNTMFYGTCCNGNFSGWQKQATTTQVQELQTQLTAISNMLMESANLKEE